MRFLREQEKEFLNEIDAMSSKLIHHINYLRDAAVASLHDTCVELLTNIERDNAQLEKITDHIQMYSDRISKSSTRRQGDNIRYFVQQKLKQNICAEAECILDVMNSCEKKAIGFTKNFELYDCVLSATCIGQVQEEVLTMVPEIESVEKVKIKGKGDHSNCGISGICQLPDGTVILCDNDNDKLKRLDEQYKVRDECNLAHCPSGVCCTGEREVAVKMYNNKIHFVSVSDRLSVTRSIQVDGGNVVGIQYCFDKIWVSETCAIGIYSTSGEPDGKILSHSDTHNNNNNILRSSPQQIAVGSDKTIYVADFSDRVFCLNEKGEVQSTLSDRRLRESQGVCVSSNDIVFVAGYVSNNIVMFGKDGKRLGEIPASLLNLKKPCALLYDKINNTLLIGCWEGNKITVVHFQE